MQKLGYYNGTCGPLDEMTVPMNDRASWFGDGVYDAGLSRNYHIFALGEHIDRLFRSAAALRIEMPLSKQELADLLNKFNWVEETEPFAAEEDPEVYMVTWLDEENHYHLIISSDGIAEWKAYEKWIPAPQLKN